MDFFGLQDSRKKQSAILLLFFIIAMLAMAIVVHVIATLVSIPLGKEIDLTQPSTPAKAFIAVIWFTCFIGCFFRILDVRAGGVALAKRFGAIEASTSGRYRSEHVLLDIVAEIAVASSCAQPRVFILHGERAINAFVVGGFSGKEALVVSQGALDKLDRDELSAVVAHEFGHISQGDIPVNMRLLIALGGLNAIDEVGQILMVEDVKGNLFAQPGVVVGLVLRVIGSIGVFFGRLIRSAFSRQREYLADACAVQFTRNPENVAAALCAVRDEHDDQAIHGVHAEELAHLCFQTGDIVHWYQRIFATHPPIQRRIDAIDPHFDTKMRSRARATEDKKPKLYSVGNGGAAIPMSGRNSASVMPLSDIASMTLSDSTACLAALHAIFTSDDQSKRTQYFNAIGFAYNKDFARQVEQVNETLNAELKNSQLAVIEHAAEQLRSKVKLENRQRFLQSLEKLLVVEGEFTLMNYATMQLIRRKLDADFPVLEQVCGDDTELAQGTLAKTFDTMGSEFALLLSLIVESSGNDAEQLDEQFAAALSCYTKKHYSRRSAAEAGIVKELESSFQTLYVQPRLIREAFVRHCLEIAQSDGHIAKDERALLNLFALSLDCEAIAALGNKVDFVINPDFFVFGIDIQIQFVIVDVVFERIAFHCFVAR